MYLTGALARKHVKEREEIEKEKKKTSRKEIWVSEAVLSLFHHVT